MLNTFLFDCEHSSYTIRLYTEPSLLLLFSEACFFCRHPQKRLPVFSCPLAHSQKEVNPLACIISSLLYCSFLSFHRPFQKVKAVLTASLCTSCHTHRLFSQPAPALSAFFHPKLLQGTHRASRMIYTNPTVSSFCSVTSQGL